MHRTPTRPIGRCRDGGPCRQRRRRRRRGPRRRTRSAGRRSVVTVYTAHCRNVNGESRIRCIQASGPLAVLLASNIPLWGWARPVERCLARPPSLCVCQPAPHESRGAQPPRPPVAGLRHVFHAPCRRQIGGVCRLSHRTVGGGCVLMYCTVLRIHRTFVHCPPVPSDLSAAVTILPSHPSTRISHARPVPTAPLDRVLFIQESRRCS